MYITSLFHGVKNDNGRVKPKYWSQWGLPRPKCWTRTSTLALQMVLSCMMQRCKSVYVSVSVCVCWLLNLPCIIKIAFIFFLSDADGIPWSEIHRYFRVVIRVRPPLDREMASPVWQHVVCPGCDFGVPIKTSIDYLRFPVATFDYRRVNSCFSC